MGKLSKLHINKPGLLTLIEDCGRKGYEAYGVPNSGVMDRSSARMANWMVGNDPATPLLEITMLGPEIEFEGSCQIALTGARLSPAIDGASVEMYRTIDIESGSKISFGRPVSGCRCYLAVAGQWKVRSWLGSSSAFTFSPELTPDSMVKKDSRIEISQSTRVKTRTIPLAAQPTFDPQQQVKVLEGPEYGDFSDAVKNYFTENTFEVGPESDRMGYRLLPPIPDYKQGKEVISSGIVRGTIQITNSGQPIVLMADAQTSGGYPRMANVISAHFDRLAQMRPGDRVQFSLTSLQDAYLAHKDEQGFLHQVMA